MIFVIAFLRLSLAISIFLLTFFLSVNAQVRVRGHFKGNGTYVKPYVRTSPDKNPYNNYSFPGNYNPNTGEVAKGDPTTYLSRYYLSQGSQRSTVLTGRGEQWSTGSLSTLPRLPDYLPVEELTRAKSYCTSLYSGDPSSASSCEVGQYRALDAIVLPNYSDVLPKDEVDRGISYCEWLFGDNRAGFYDCANRQLLGLAKPPANFVGVDANEETRAKAYCEWLYSDNRAGYQSCTESQARVLSRPSTQNASDLPTDEMARANRYCEWLYSNNRAGAQQCKENQIRTIRSNLRINSEDLPPDEWSRSTKYCEWLYADNRGGAFACLNNQASGLRSAMLAKLMTSTLSAESVRYCEWLYKDNRQGYWSCIRSRN